MKIGLSVGVQQMVRSDLASSEVMFSIDTESGFGSYGIDPRNPLISGGQPAGGASVADGKNNLAGDPHLRSCKKVDQYVVEAENSRFGHVVDFLISDKTWEIQSLLVEGCSAGINSSIHMLLKILMKIACALGLSPKNSEN